MGDLTKNFSRSEFACKCGCGADTVDWELLTLLQSLRSALSDHEGRNVVVTVHSGHRCPKHNAAVGGAPGSQHLYGRAADISAAGIDTQDLGAYIEELFGDTMARGLGIYNTWVHVDTRTGAKARW